MIHDRDTIYSEGVDQTLEAMGLVVLKPPARASAPQANTFCGRSIGTIRRECFPDFVIPMTERHLRAILREWIGHYNRGRPHASLGQAFPTARSSTGSVTHAVTSSRTAIESPRRRSLVAYITNIVSRKKPREMPVQLYCGSGVDEMGSHCLRLAAAWPSLECPNQIELQGLSRPQRSETGPATAGTFPYRSPPERTRCPRFALQQLGTSRRRSPSRALRCGLNFVASNGGRFPLFVSVWKFAPDEFHYDAIKRTVECGRDLLCELARWQLRPIDIYL